MCLFLVFLARLLYNSVAKVSLELLVLLFLTPECWDCMTTPLCLALSILRRGPTVCSPDRLKLMMSLPPCSQVAGIIGRAVTVVFK